MHRSENEVFSRSEMRLTQTAERRDKLERQAFEELETEVTESVGWGSRWREKARRGYEAGLAKKVARRRVLEQQSTQPLELKKGRKWFVLTLVSLLLCLLGLSLFAGPPLVKSWSVPVPNATLQHALHPQTTVSRETALRDTANLFMSNMQRKNWSALWWQLSPDARSLWQSEQAFEQFEQAKFGPLTLQSYSLGQSVISQPWLNPNTTQILPSAAVMQVSLQATAPNGVLTVPSQRELARGLFKRTLFALVQQGQTWQVEVAGPADPGAPVLVPAHPPVKRLLIPIYMYHHISSLPTKNQFDFNLTVTTANFNAQLTWMQQQGYQAITMTELFDNFYYGKALPRKPMMLTFDDGYSDVYTYALPVLLAHHYRGVFYIITGMIGGRYVTWDQVRAMDRAGMQIASHTIHHVNIGEPPAGTTTQDELVKSRAKLEEILLKPIQFFCYPTGEPFHHDTPAEQKLVLQDLFNDGYLSATLDPAAFNSALQNSQQPYQLPRIRVSGGEDLATFRGILAATLQADVERLKAL